MTDTLLPTVVDTRRPIVRSSSQSEDFITLRATVRRPARTGLLIGIAFVAVFGGWALCAPLAGGAVAPGVISPDGSRKTVQHLEGGIINQLHARDGDTVKVGQPLLTLESVQPRTTYEALANQHSTLLATRARLQAEQADRSELEFPAELKKAAEDGALQAVVQGQRQMFETRRASHAARKRVLRQRIEQFQEQIKAYDAQVKSASVQLSLIADELVGKEQLRQKQIITKPEILRLQRVQAELAGQQGEYVGSISRIRQQIGETEIQLLALEADRADQIATQLDQVRSELAAIKERLAASEDILKRTVVTAPVNGKVVNLRFKTEKGVVGRGEPILDIVPGDDPLLIDARVAPTDIDVVHVGLSALVHLSAYSNRAVGRIDGIVRSVSADRIVDQQTGMPYYLARIEVDRAQLKRISPDIELVAGMPADVLITTGERTLMEYFLEPFLNAFRRSFREV
jgi:HlyD family secretion protein/epimerase transport system membrane fusion protein